MINNLLATNVTALAIVLTVVIVLVLVLLLLVVLLRYKKCPSSSASNAQ